MHRSKLRALLDDLISTSQEHRRKLQPERPCCPHVHHELEFCRLLNRKITRLDALQDLFDLARRTPVEIVKTRSIRYQTARIHHFPQSVDGRHLVADRKFRNFSSKRGKFGIISYHQRVITRKA